ncbi:T9SS-dependent choice-of-anchor J family protein [Soonwooa sp.]|uniref:T9SS-dependent choice-of-anchor J family protein n=1 Tax=Soonwooa sp. TaxID=1938592 RepID=UPI0028A968D4|nr:choice-of-anchor J domain-containing protein [Soonwooa sp.]
MKKQFFILAVALPLAFNAQFFQNFDANTNIPTGWAVINGGDTNTWQIVNFTGSTGIAAYSGTNTVSIGYNAVAHDDYLVTPAIAVTAGVNDYFSFYARSRDPLYPEKIALKLSETTPTAAAFTTVLAANVDPASGANFYKYEYDLSSYVGKTVYIAFHSTTQDKFYFDIDDVASLAKPLCNIPVNVTYSNVTSNSAKINWAANGTGNNYQVEYGPAGFSHGGGTVLSVSDETANLSLTPNTAYDVYVRKNCNPTFSDWSNKISFTTNCSANTVFPMIEKFDANAVPTCWKNETVSGGGSAVWTYVTTNGNATITPKSAPRMAEFRTTTVGNKSMLVVKPLDLSSVTNPVVKFSYANTNWFGDVDELRVYYKANSSDQWTQLGPAYTTEKTAWTDVTLPLPNKSSNYQIAFEGMSNWARGINLDDVMVGDATTLAVGDLLKSKVKLYPNPVKDVLNIDVNTNINSIEIYTITGQLVRSLDKKTKQVDVSHLANGVYILRLKSDSTDESYKIVKD